MYVQFVSHSAASNLGIFVFLRMKEENKKSYCELVQIGPKLLQLVGEFYA